MANYYDELEIEDFAWDATAKVFHYPCPCGDRFEISKAQLRDGEEIATCPSCSLIVRVIYDYLDWEDYTTTDDEEGLSDEEEADEEAGTPGTNTPPSPSPIAKPAKGAKDEAAIAKDDNNGNPGPSSDAKVDSNGNKETEPPDKPGDVADQLAGLKIQQSTDSDVPKQS